MSGLSARPLAAGLDEVRDARSLSTGRAASALSYAASLASGLSSPGIIVCFVHLRFAATVAAIPLWLF
jgi:hypothetical protein